MGSTSSLGAADRPASPISAGRGAAPRTSLRILYSAVSVGAKSLVPLLRPFIQNPSINWAVLTGNGNIENKKLDEGDLCTSTKYHPAPRSETHTHQLITLSTHLSFRWTLPLTEITFFCILPCTYKNKFKSKPPGCDILTKNS